MLPPGPSTGPLAQTIALHRDPLGVLRRAQARHGDVFTLRLATVRPIVVVAAASEAEPLLTADPGTAHAGEARRRMLPMVSPRSIFGSDGAQHAAARGRLAPLFAPAAVERHRQAIAAIGIRHAGAWPGGRPVRLLPRMRALVDEIFVRRLLGVGDDGRARAIAAAIGRMLWTPGNPPLSIPGAGDGLLGAAGAALFERKRAPLARLLGAEIDARRERPDDDDILGRTLREEPELSTAAIVDELLALLMAAQEPAAASLTWLFERLARQPGLDHSSQPVVRETLRLRPPAIAALRRLSQERDVAGHRLPAGATVMLPIPLLQRDPGAYPDPDEFRPDRWTSGSPPTAFSPFGGGTRRCIGEHLAHAYFAALVPAILGCVRLRPALPRFERMVLRGTILVPRRGAPVIVGSPRDRGGAALSGH